MDLYKSLGTTPQGFKACALGLFDGVHLGHKEVLSAVIGHEGLIPTVFTFDTKSMTPLSKQEKGFRLILSEGCKLSALERAGIECVISPPFDEIAHIPPRQFIEDVLIGRMGVRFIACGYDYRFGSERGGDTALLTSVAASHGIKTVVCPPVLVDGEPISATSIRRLIEAGDIKRANRFLLHPYSIDFPVVHGMRLAATLGFPTINQAYDEGFILPRFGVYVTRAFIGGEWCMSVTNVGVKPTVTSSNTVLAETHILGYEGSLYGENVTVEFLEFVREEKKFGSLDELKEQIAMDVSHAKSFLNP